MKHFNSCGCHNKRKKEIYNLLLRLFPPHSQLILPPKSCSYGRVIQAGRSGAGSGGEACIHMLAREKIIMDYRLVLTRRHAFAITAWAGWQGWDWAHTRCVWMLRCWVSFSVVSAAEERERSRHTTQWHLIDRYVVVSVASLAGKTAGVNLPSQAPLTRVQGDTVLVSPRRTRPLADMAFDQDHQSILASSCEIAHMVSNLIYTLVHRALKTLSSWEMHIFSVSDIENYT